MGGRLGCGEYIVTIGTRGGSSTLGELPFKQLNFGRVLDGVSNCTASAGAAGDKWSKCCEMLSQVNPYQHEINVYRDGYLSWAGPIIEISYSLGSISISARDLMHWFERRFLPKDRRLEGDLAQIFDKFVEDALEGDPSPNITIRSRDTGIRGERTIKAKDFIRAMDALSELARTGLDFTAIGRTVYTGGIEIHFDEPLRVWTPAIRIAHMTRLGLEMATRVVVIGSPQSRRSGPVNGYAGGVSSQYGLIEQRYPEPLIDDEKSMRENANARLALVRESPRTMNISLDERAPFEFRELIPGRQLDVRTEIDCMEIIGLMRLQSVAANVVPIVNGGVSESIDTTVTPLGLEGEV